jgi:mxaL protein
VSRRLDDAGLWIACLLLIVALCLVPQPVMRRLPNVVAVLDITQSMNAVDARVGGRAVDRLTFAKAALQRAVTDLPCGSKVGLGIFTQFRILVLTLPVETCANRRELLQQIESINGQMAWAGGSEIAKGLYLALHMFKAIEHPPALLLLTDGHEAPPIDPHHRINIADEAASVRGAIVGIGGATLVAIPKVDPEGYPAGVWGPNDVLQEDRYKHGRQGTVQNEAMSDAETGEAVAPGLLGTPGFEHLTSLREPYLRLIAAEAKFSYQRLQAVDALAPVLMAPECAEPQIVRQDFRGIAGALALFGLLVGYLVVPLRSLQRRIATRLR